MTIILGAGVTGLAAGIASGAPIYEASSIPGGICASYYVRPGTCERLWSAPKDQEAYRFELGGGHWIWGGDSAVMVLAESLAPMKPHERRASVYFRDNDLYVPYPLQDHLHCLGTEVASQAIAEMARPLGVVTTMKDWLEHYFGPTLCTMFFNPFHELYTAGLYGHIAAQDAFKSPVNLSRAIRGASSSVGPTGYNTTFVYPEEGLNTLAQRMAGLCTVHYDKKAVRIDSAAKVLHFEDGSNVRYDRLISTVPLQRACKLAGLSCGVEPDPYTSVLVLNIGAVKGPRCPEDHWLYNPDAKSGLHRVGFYSNVSETFLPGSVRDNGQHVSIYVERAYVGGVRPTRAETAEYSQRVIQELQSWGYVEEIEVVDPTWIDVAYTYAWPGSRWKSLALAALEEQSIFQVGRFARWVCQGVADSLKDGLVAGAALGERS